MHCQNLWNRHCHHSDGFSVHPGFPLSRGRSCDRKRRGHVCSRLSEPAWFRKAMRGVRTLADSLGKYVSECQNVAGLTQFGPAVRPCGHTFHIGPPPNLRGLWRHRLAGQHELRLDSLQVCVTHLPIHQKALAAETLHGHCALATPRKGLGSHAHVIKPTSFTHRRWQSCEPCTFMFMLSLEEEIGQTHFSRLCRCVHSLQCLCRRGATLRERTLLALSPGRATTCQAAN
jgi:hypothetical protein